MNMVEAYPLQWPVGWSRTETPEESRFGQWNNKPSVAYARGNVLNELRRLGAESVIISTNMELRQDGLPYSNKREPTDSGVAIYFILDGKGQCIPCDRWRTVGENLWAIYKSIEALRGLDRWGAKSFVDAAFSGFKALPAPGDGCVLTGVADYFQGCISKEDIDSTFKSLAKELHPDQGGKQDEFIELQRQKEIALSKFE